MKRDDILKDLPARVGRAVAHDWGTRGTQRDKQRLAGRADQGLRSAVTGGAHMDGFIDLFTELVVDAHQVVKFFHMALVFFPKFIHFSLWYKFNLVPLLLK